MAQQAVCELFDRTDRVAIVMGGTGGIGLASSHGFVGACAKVVAASHQPDACAAAEKQLIQQALPYPRQRPSAFASSFIQGQVVKSDEGLVPG